MKYISNAKYGEPVETGTIYRGDNKRLDICVHTLCGCGETLYMNCQALNIRDRKLNSTSVIAAINEAQSLAKQELDLLSKELNTILNSEIEISRHQIGESMEDRYLFKAKRADNGEWVTGHYVKGLDIYAKEVHLIFEPTTIFYSSGETDGWSEVDPSTICQCTGLKDRNGKLIWENDIVNIQCGKAIVIWDKAEWRIKWIKDTIWRKDLHFWTNEDDWKCEIIGNIFDNPELLGRNDE